MVHLPTEIWLQIASYCEAKDLWLSLRPSNRQLRACAEQRFKEDIMPQAILNLRIRIPTYDMRNPLQTIITFRPLDIMRDAGNAVDEGNGCRVTFKLVETEPTYYHSHFLSRCKGMQGSQGGRLSDRMTWELDFCGQRETQDVCARSTPVHLKEPVAEFFEDDSGSEARLSFEWMPIVTSFFRNVG